MYIRHRLIKWAVYMFFQPFLPPAMKYLTVSYCFVAGLFSFSSFFGDIFLQNSYNVCRFIDRLIIIMENGNLV